MRRSRPLQCHMTQGMTVEYKVFGGFSGASITWQSLKDAREVIRREVAKVF